MSESSSLCFQCSLCIAMMRNLEIMLMKMKWSCSNGLHREEGKPADNEGDDYNCHRSCRLQHVFFLFCIFILSSSCFSAFSFHSFCFQTPIWSLPRRLIKIPSAPLTCFCSQKLGSVPLPPGWQFFFLHLVDKIKRKRKYQISIHSSSVPWSSNIVQNLFDSEVGIE